MPSVGANLQTLPPVIRPYCLIDEGYIGVNQDMAQAENRIVAWYGPELTMRKAFEDGTDVHRNTYARMFDVPYDSVSDEPGSSDFGDGSKSQRFWGKQCNHSLNYDLSFLGFGIKYEVPPKQAKELIERYHAAYPGVRASYQKRIIDELHKSRTITNPYGRTRAFMGRMEAGTYREAYAHLPSSTVADHMNLNAFLPLWEYSYPAEAELLLQVHDSVYYQLPISAGFKSITQTIKIVKDSLERPIPFEDPFIIPADTEVGFNYGKRNINSDKGTLNPDGLRKLTVGTVEETAIALENIWREHEHS